MFNIVCVILKISGPGTISCGFASKVSWIGAISSMLPYLDGDQGLVPSVMAYKESRSVSIPSSKGIVVTSMTLVAVS